MSIQNRAVRPRAEAKMTADWFDRLSQDDQHDYLAQHPHSKYWHRVKQNFIEDKKKERQARQEDDARKGSPAANDPPARHRQPVNHGNPLEHLHTQKPEVIEKGLQRLNKSEKMEPHSDFRRQVGERLREKADKVADSVKRKLGDDQPHAETALNEWAAGKPVTGRNKQALRKAAKLAFATAMVVMPGGLFALAAIHFGPRLIRGALNTLKDPRNAKRVAKDGDPYKSLVNSMSVELEKSKMNLTDDEIAKLAKGVGRQSSK